MDLRAVVFVPALAGCVIFGFVFALFAAHHYLTVVQSTGAGAKEVAWPAEPILDQFWKVFYLAWLIGLWLGPAWLLAAATTTTNDPRWVRFAIPLGVFWIFYPVSQLSSLGGPTIWLPLHPGVIERLVRKAAVLPGFFLLSGVVLTVFGLAFYLTFLAPGIISLVAGSILLVVAGLLYGRLIGRLAFAIIFTKSTLGKLGKRKKKRSRQEESGRPRQPVSTENGEPDGEFIQPASLPPIETPDEGPLTGYDVVVDTAKPRARRRVVAEVVRDEQDAAIPFLDTPAPAIEPDRSEPEDDEDRPYGVDEPEVPPGERAPPEVVQPSEMEMKLLARDDVVRPPKRVWSPDLAAFLVQPGTISVVLLLSAMCFAVGGMVRIAREFDPTRN
jgi:hypothetical protein